MARITVDEQEFTYERQAKTRSDAVYEMEVVAESRTGGTSIRRFEMDASARGDLTADQIETELDDWQADHGNLTVRQFVVRETNGCGFGERVGPATADGTTDPTAADGRTRDDSTETPLYRGGSASYHRVEFGDVPVERGEEVEFHVAGPSTSVYGTDTGTVTGLKTGTEDHHVLIVETDSGEKRVREDWLVDENDFADDGEDGDGSDGES